MDAVSRRKDAGKALDLGCGTGAFSVYLAMQDAAGAGSFLFTGTAGGSLQTGDHHRSSATNRSAGSGTVFLVQVVVTACRGGQPPAALKTCQTHRESSRRV